MRGSSPRMTPERGTQSNRKMLLMPAYSRHHAAEQTHRSDVLIPHRWRALDPSACLRGHRRAISLTTIFDEHYPTLGNMASRADERMVLDTTYSHCMVRDHLRQDQLSATGNTTHHSHTKPHAEAPTRARGV